MAEMLVLYNKGFERALIKMLQNSNTKTLESKTKQNKKQKAKSTSTKKKFTTKNPRRHKEDQKEISEPKNTKPHKK